MDIENKLFVGASYEIVDYFQLIVWELNTYDPKTGLHGRSRLGQPLVKIKNRTVQIKSRPGAESGPGLVPSYLLENYMVSRLSVGAHFRVYLYLVMPQKFSEIDSVPTWSRVKSRDYAGSPGPGLNQNKVILVQSRLFTRNQVGTRDRI